MAILNYSKTYQEVLNDFEVTRLQDLAESNVGDYIKLFFDGEGNILTHGVNYTPLFFHQDATITRRGLVPVNTSGNIKEILRGNGSWAELATSDLPIWEQGNPYDADTILNSEQVNLLVQQSFIANEAMRFKGVVSSVSDIESSWKVGDTYRVNTGGSANIIIYEHICQTGDLLICIKEGDSTAEYPRTHWAVVQTNINGTNTIKINNATLKFYTDDIGATYNDIFAPTTNGWQQNQPKKLLVSANNSTGSPVWATLSEGLRINDTLNILTLNAATNNTLGGVKIDANSGLNNNPTISVNTDGTIYLTKENIINALRYIPADSATLSDALSLATRDKKGLTPMFDEIIAPSLDVNTWLLGVTKGAAAEYDKYGWYPIPPTAFSDTWRKIIIGNVDIEDSELHINPSDDVCVKVDNNPDDDIVSISFGLSWYNISTGAYETA